MDIDGVIETATKYMRDKIIVGELRGGEKLNEVELAEELKISRPPIREALRTLENEKLVCRIPRKGTYVTKISIDDCVQLFEVRKCIESSAIEILFKNLTIDAALTRIRFAEQKAKQFHLPEFPTPTDYLDLYRILTGFHFALVSSSENNWLIHLYMTLSSCLARYQILNSRISGAMGISISDHSDIVKNISDGNLPKAKEALYAHVDSVVVRIREQITFENNPEKLLYSSEKDQSFSDFQIFSTSP